MDTTTKQSHHIVTHWIIRINIKIKLWKNVYIIIFLFINKKFMNHEPVKEFKKQWN